MFNIVLYQPEIPPNTGNIMRLCANTKAQLHLIKPLGFTLDDKKMRRAGLDYHHYTNVLCYDSFCEYLNHNKHLRHYACSTKGHKRYSDVSYKANDSFIFGPETRGLPDEILSDSCVIDIITIPMQEHSRSLNLANAVSIITYEAWRQLDFNLS